MENGRLAGRWREVPGLYFVGLHWLRTWGTGLVCQVGRDAEYVVNRLCRNVC